MCGCGRGKGLCPVSLGLALGITTALAVFIWSVWMMYYGVPPMMAPFHMSPPTWGSSALHALVGLIKGFVFGFVLALFYDLFACWFKSMCHKSDKTCECGCDCCSMEKPARKR